MVIEIERPGLLAAAIGRDLLRLRRAHAATPLPVHLADLADALSRVVGMLNEADARGQTVQLAEGVVSLLREFRAALSMLHAPAQA